MQVGRLQPVAVEEPQLPDAGARQVADDRDAQTAAPDDEHTRGAQLRLAGGADLLECRLA